MREPERDDLFLDTLEQDEELAWKLAEATSRAARPGVRQRVVERHRRRGVFTGMRLPAPLRAAVALLVLVATGAALLVQVQGADLEVAAALAGDVRIVHMETSAAVAGRGFVVVRNDEQAYLVLDLPSPPAGKAYEAWVIRDGHPIRAGMAPARPGIVTLRLQHPVRAGDITAVTLENAAGVDQPTSDPILIGPA